MRRDLGVTMAVMLAAAPLSAAGTGKADVSRRAAREDAARLMKEAVRTGTADAAAFAAIVDWILYEKEEKVAAGLIDVLGAVEPTIAGPGLPLAGREPDPPLAGERGERWNDTTRAMLSLFTSVLRDAEGHRRRSADANDPELSALLSAAAPAVAGALREVDPAAKARFLAALGALGPAADDLVPLLAKALRHPQREVRMGAATGLAALGRSAGAAVPALRAAADDPDGEVRAAAGEALRKIEGQ